MDETLNIDNVVYMDEYPHLLERVQLRFIGQLALELDEPGQLILFPVAEGEPDGAA